MKRLLFLLLFATTALAQDSATVYGADGGYRGSIQFHEGVHWQQPAQQTFFPSVALELRRMQQADDPLTSYMRAAQFQQNMQAEALQQKLMQQQIELVNLQNQQLRKAAESKSAVISTVPKDKPIHEKFDTYEAYTEALIDWKIAQASIHLAADAQGCVSYKRHDGTMITDCN